MMGELFEYAIFNMLTVVERIRSINYRPMVYKFGNNTLLQYCYYCYYLIHYPLSTIGTDKIILISIH